MRQVLLFFFLLTFYAFSNAQSDGQVKIVRTDGRSIIGALQSADSNVVTIKIAGVEMIIPMSEVQYIEEYSIVSTQLNAEETSVNTEELSDHYGDYIIIDNNPAYPDSFTVEVDGRQITMVLVRGGIFNMGYDERHSLSMKSEPVHKVELSSYYVSDNFVVPYTTNWGEANRIVNRIAAEQGAPYRLLTEAEWEYAAILPIQELVFGKTYQKELKMISNLRTHINDSEWCQDFYGGFTAQRQVDPTGPKKKEGKRHVMRVYSKEFVKWWRIHAGHKGHVRIAISADKIPNINE